MVKTQSIKTLTEITLKKNKKENFCYKKKTSTQTLKIKRHLRNLFNRSLSNRGEKKLYQQMKRTHEHMLTSSKIPTKKQKQSALNNF